MQLTNITRTISLIGVTALAATAARAIGPPPDQSYANQKTAEGDLALLNLATGSGNTPIGFSGLFFDNTGSSNTLFGFWKDIESAGFGPIPAR